MAEADKNSRDMIEIKLHFNRKQTMGGRLCIAAMR